MLIAFDGLDGSGKTTQLERLVEALDPDHEIVATKQPTNAYRSDERVVDYLNRSEEDRSTPRFLAELALFAASDRLRHHRETVEPALDAGALVITDRWHYSTLAYFSERGIAELSWLIEINAMSLIPDLTFVFDVRVEDLQRRIVERGDPLKAEDHHVDLQRRVRASFLSEPWGSSPGYHVLDGNRSVDDVAAEVVSIVKAAMIERPSHADRQTLGMSVVKTPIEGTS